jgi:rod shape-determining protein MreC
MAARASRSRSVLYVVVLSSVTLLAFGRIVAPVRGRVQDRLASLDSAGARAARPVNRVAGKVLSYDAMKKENTRLVAELDKARASSLRYDDAVRERKELLALNGYIDPDGYRSVGARIIGSPLNNFDETIRIDRGSDQGLAVNMPVTSAAGLVGRVSAVSPKHATIELITNPKLSVGVRFSRSGEVAVANGQHAGKPLRLDLVALTAKVARGDVVVTSGLQNSAFPPGIPVGRVRTVRAGSILQDVTISPVVDLERIGFVKVLVTKAAP